MRPPSDMPRRRRRLRFPAGRRRMLLVVVLVVVFVVLTSLRTIAAYYTDYLWFDSLDRTSVWNGVQGTKLGLVAVFTLGFFALMWSNLLIAERLSGRTIRFGGSSEDELVLKYRELVGRRAAVVRSATAGLVALAAGGGTASQWNNWILLRNHVEFGERDATFGKDIGFYVFQLPFLRFVVSWTFSALVVVTVVTVVAHYLNGGIRLQATQDRVGAAVKAHISVLLAALALVRAGQYWLDRYELVFSRRGPVDGAAYTDVNVQLRSIDLLVLISIFATVLFLVNIRRRGWVLPVMAVGIWALVAVLAGEAVPALVQRFRVDGQRSALERPFVENNIEATRAAMGLDGVEEEGFAASPDLGSADLDTNAETVRNIRLWDPNQIQPIFDNQQAARRYFEIPDVDVDRYTVNGETRQMMVGARDLDDSRLPLGSSGWEASRLVYTYGYGTVMAPSNAMSSQGQPTFSVGDIPTESAEGYPEIAEPKMYFGESVSGYKIIDTDRAELDIAQSGEEGVDDAGDGGSTSAYTGRDGVPLDGFLRRAAFALRFNEIEPLTSGSIRSSSRVILQRDVRDRVQALAPFLAFDADPYPVVDEDGRIVYVIDAYTTTDRYPNAQRATFDEDLPQGSGLRGRAFNYARNSVKAVVDAYDGTVTLYVTDTDDPLVRAYRQAFPDLFASLDEAPHGLADHFRYPEDLFRVQTGFWGRYHIVNPETFLNDDEGVRWTVAGAAESTDAPTTTTTAAGTASSTTQPVEDAEESQRRIEPTYQQVRLPGQEQTDFVLLRPFTIRGRPELSSFLTATPDGRLRGYTLPRGRDFDGPDEAADKMANDQTVSDLGKVFENNDAAFGNLILVPIEDSILYVQSMYATSGDQTQIKAVIVAYQDDETADLRVEVGVTLEQALRKMFGDSPETLEATPSGEGSIDEVLDGTTDPDTDEPSPDEPDQPEIDDDFDGTDAELIAAIQDEFDQARQALEADGDLAEYQRHVDRAERLLDILASRQEIEDGAGAGESGETPAEGGGSGGAEAGPGATTTTTEPVTAEGRTTPSTTTTTAPPPSTSAPPGPSTTPQSAPSSTTTTRPSA